MPSVEVRQRRAARAAQGRDDIEGGARSQFDEYALKQNQEQPVTTNPILRFLEQYPAVLTVFLMVLVVLTYRLLHGQDY